MLSRLGSITLLLAACGQGTDPTGIQVTGSARSPQTSIPPATPERPAGAFRLTITADLSEEANAPAGYRILRLPPRLEDLPTGVQVNRREVQKGAWRSYPKNGQPLIVDLFPTDDVLDDRWMVVAYAENDVHGFRYADNDFRRVEVGTSKIFALQAEGGELALSIEVRPAISLIPRFRDEEAIEGPFGFEFSYGPIASAPRRIRGTWSGDGNLPFLISRYAIGRHGYVSLFQHAWPSETELGPVGFVLTGSPTEINLPQPESSGPLHLQVYSPTGETCTEAIVLGGFIGKNGEWEMTEAGRTNAQARLTIPNAQAGRYHLSARLSESDKVLLGWIATDGSEYEGRIATPPSLETGKLDLLDLPESKGWEVEVWSFWGALMVGHSKGRPGEDLTLPHAGEMRHQALARRWDKERGITEAHLYLECEWHEGAWHFHAAPTLLSIENFTDELGLVLRLNRTEDREPEQFFPPKAWQVEPGGAETTDYFPIPFRGGLELQGLPEGQYEAGIWGLEPTTERMAELATFWPVSEEVISEDE
ncbi:MAG: hypothetical protein MK209_06665 [Planctomycetes bacterium]|nr:hypothetical protein [Planctomycetota bacterium]